MSPLRCGRCLKTGGQTVSRDLKPFTGMTRRWFVRIEWKPQDCWLGVFWKRDYPWALDVWICLLPMLPLHFGWKPQIQHNADWRANR